MQGREVLLALLISALTVGACVLVTLALQGWMRPGPITACEAVASPWEATTCGPLAREPGPPHPLTCSDGLQCPTAVRWVPNVSWDSRVVEPGDVHPTVPMRLQAISPKGYRRGVLPPDGGLAPGEIALTFDDGPKPRSLEPILDALDAYGVRATFFVVGWRAERHPEWVREILARGHTVATHTYKHHYFVKLGFEEAKRQVVKGYNATMEAAGDMDEVVTPFFRFPGGLSSARTEHVGLVKSLGLAIFEWNMSTKDTDALRMGMAARRRGVQFGEPFTCDEELYVHYMAEAVYERTIDYIRKKKGGILLLHDTKDATAYALPWILSELAEPYHLAEVAAEIGVERFTHVQFVYNRTNRRSTLAMPKGGPARYRESLEASEPQAAQ